MAHKGLKLDLTRFKRDLESQEVGLAIIRREGTGDANNIKSVPTLFLIPPTGNPLRFNNLHDLQQWCKKTGKLKVE